MSEVTFEEFVPAELALWLERSKSAYIAERIAAGDALTEAQISLKGRKNDENAPDPVTGRKGRNRLDPDIPFARASTFSCSAFAWAMHGSSPGRSR